MYAGVSEGTMRDMQAEIACFSIPIVQSIIERDGMEIGDKRISNNPKRIYENQEEEIRDKLIATLRKDLSNRVPILTKDVRSWMIR